MKTSIPRSTLEKLREFDTAHLAGAIQSVTPTLGPTVGVALTCTLDSSTPGNRADTKAYWRQLEEMTAAGIPIVWVVQTVGARPDHECVIGDGMAKTLHAAGCVGLVTNGRVRDVNGLLSTPFAAYCQGTISHHCALRFQDPGEPVEMGGVTIRPGDVIHANAEGIIKIPPTCLDRLPEAAVRMRAFEHDMHRMLRRTDLPPAEKRRRVGAMVAQYGLQDCVAGPGSGPVAKQAKWVSTQTGADVDENRQELC